MDFRWVVQFKRKKGHRENIVANITKLRRCRSQSNQTTETDNDIMNDTDDIALDLSTGPNPIRAVLMECPLEAQCHVATSGSLSKDVSPTFPIAP